MRSGDQFHAQCLRIYIGRFDFANDPLDVALRKLLMEVGLPRETQQIDRVMEAFAARYRQCNPDLFISDGETDCRPQHVRATGSISIFRSSVHSSVQSHHVTHGRVQQIQQEEDDKTRLYEEHPTSWCFAGSTGCTSFSLLFLSLVLMRLAVLL